jgi:Tropinone reductase 1
MFDFSGKWVLITGATKGIGRATSECFAEAGANLILVSRNIDDLAALRHRIQANGEIEIYQVDLAQSTDREKLVEFCQEKLDQLDVLVNNVGSNIRKPNLEFSEADVIKLFQTNTISAWKLCTSLHSMLRKGGGAVVNVSSVASFRFVFTSTAAYAMR